MPFRKIEASFLRKNFQFIFFQILWERLLYHLHSSTSLCYNPEEQIEQGENFSFFQIPSNLEWEKLEMEINSLPDCQNCTFRVQRNSLRSISKFPKKCLNQLSKFLWNLRPKIFNKVANTALYKSCWAC